MARVPTHGHQHPEMRARAKALREAATRMEEQTWSLLRRGRMDGLKFRRQHIIDVFIVDFYCAELALVIELDGGIHDEQRAADERRDALLLERGVLVVRIKNDDVSDERLRSVITARAADFRAHGEPRRSEAPLPLGEG